MCRYSACNCAANTLLRPSRIGPRSMSISNPGHSSTGNNGQSFNRPSVTSNNRCCSAGKRFCRAAKPSPRFAQRRQQRRAATGAKTIEPMAQPGRGLQSLHLPLRCSTAGREQRQARTLAIGIVEQLRQQALGIAQCLMTAGRCRGIDDHQPQFMGRASAQVKQQVVALTRAAIEQCAGPVDRAAAGRMTLTLFAVVQPPGSGSGIRPRVGARANA